MKTNLDRMLRAGLYLTLLTPLLFYRSSISPFITLRTFVFQALIEVLAAVWLALAVFHPEYRPRPTLLMRALLVLLLLLTLSAFIGPDLMQGMWSTQGRALGLVALYHFFLFFVMLSSVPRFDLRRWFMASTGVAVVASLFAFYQPYHPEFFLENVLQGGRPGSFLGNPSFLAGYLLFHIFFAFWFAVEAGECRLRGRLAGWLGASVLMITALFLAQTRGALIGFAAGLLAIPVYFAFARSRERTLGLDPRTLRKASAGFLLAAVLFGGLFFATRQAPLWSHVPGLNRLSSLTLASTDIQPRLTALRIAWESFKERPWLGWGPEGFKVPFDRRYDPQLLRSGFGETYFDKPHNIVLEYLVSGGILGLLGYLALFGAALWTIFRKAPREGRPFFLAMLAAYFVQNLFLFDTFGTYLIFFALLAYLDSFGRDHVVSRERHPWLARYPWAEGAAAGALVIIALLPVCFANGRILYANNRQYWGLNYFLNRMPDEAIRSYRSAIGTPHPYVDQVRIDYATALGQAFAQGLPLPDPQGNAKDALTELAKAINNHPNDYFSRVTFAEAAADLSPLNTSLVKDAENQAREAIKASPRRQQPYYSLARIQVLQGNPFEALKTMRHAVELDPLSADPHFYYGLTALGTGNNDLGFAEIARAKELGREPKTGAEARILGNFEAEAGHYEEAAKNYRNALRADPADVDTQVKLGIVDYYLGERDEAREVLRDAAARVDLTQSPYLAVLREIFHDLGLSL
jgi:O-antigen ligase/Flp pilus assembly protein TadD